MEQHTVRFASDRESEMLRLIAATGGVSVSVFIRDAALERVKRDLPNLQSELKAILATIEVEVPETTETNSLQTD